MWTLKLRLKLIVTNRYPAILPLIVAGLVLLLAGWVYWPGQYGPALLDDRSSVLVISDLKENPDYFWDYVTGNKSGPLGRPVSMASFVLEQLFLDGSLATSKRVNIVLHLFNGCLVICLFWLLFRHIATPGYRWLAVVLGAAWLLSPLYVSTVLYIVQRMAMLCTMFMLLACIGYVLWREQLGRQILGSPFFSCIPGRTAGGFCQGKRSGIHSGAIAHGGSLVSVRRAEWAENSLAAM